MQPPNTVSSNALAIFKIYQIFRSMQQQIVLFPDDGVLEDSQALQKRVEE
jgi:hypothetical protein